MNRTSYNRVACCRRTPGISGAFSRPQHAVVRHAKSLVACHVGCYRAFPKLSFPAPLFQRCLWPTPYDVGQPFSQFRHDVGRPFQQCRQLAGESGALMTIMLILHLSGPAKALLGQAILCQNKKPRTVFCLKHEFHLRLLPLNWAKTLYLLFHRP